MDAPDWAQESPSPPDWAMDSGAPDSGGIRLSTQGSQVAASQPAPQTNTQQKPGLWEGVKRGAQQFDIGSRQFSADLLDSVGLPVDPQAKEALNQGAQTLEKQGEGTGLAGTAGEIIGNPTTYLPMGAAAKGAAGLIKTGAKLSTLGATSAAVAPSENDQGLGQRAENAAEAGAYSIPLGMAGHLAGKGVGAATQWGANKTGLSSLISNVAEKLGSNPTGSDLYETAQKVGLPTTGKNAEQIYGDLQNWYSQNVGNISKGIGGDFNPLEASADISNSYGAAQQQSNDLYNQARFHGEGKTIVANDLQKQLSNAVRQLSGKQFRTQSEDASLSRLQEIQQDLGWAPRPRTATIETGTTQPTTGFWQSRMNKPQTTTYQLLNMIGYNNLVDLKQALNEGFDPTRFSSKGDRPMASLFNNVKDSLARAAEQDKDPVTGASPFGDALYNADRHYSDELAPTFKNDTIKKFWTADDYNDYKTSQGWSRRAPNVDTTGRSGKMLDNIKSPTDLQAVTQAMSPEQGNNLRSAKFKRLMTDSGLDGDKIADNYDVLKYTLQGNKAASALLDNVKEGVDQLNQRGIGDNMKFFDQSNPNFLKSAGLAGLYAKAGRPIYALKEAMKALSSKQGSAAQRRISNFASDVNSGAPSNTILNPLTNALSSQAGKQAAISVGQGMNQVEPQHYAVGGRVNKYGVLVGILRD